MTHQSAYVEKASGRRCLGNSGRSAVTTADGSLQHAASASVTAEPSLVTGHCCWALPWWDHSVQRTRSATTPDQETGHDSAADNLHPATSYFPSELQQWQRQLENTHECKPSPCRDAVLEDCPHPWGQLEDKICSPWPWDLALKCPKMLWLQVRWTIVTMALCYQNRYSLLYFLP